jgi:large subunit ribosomal protein L27e
MAKGIMKPGRVVLLLNGRFAGKKAIIVKSYDDGVKIGRRFPHALVAGIYKAPRKITKRMGKNRMAERMKIRPFIKVANYAHLMPTRYLVSGEIEPKNVATIEESDKKKFVEAKRKMLKEVKSLFEEKYKALPTIKNEKSSHVDFFFRKLNF